VTKTKEPAQGSGPSTKREDHPTKRKLTGAAAAAHAAKERGEVVTVGKPFVGKPRSVAGSGSSRSGAAVKGGSTPRAPNLLGRLRRMVM
jgi:hypothetical protein